MKFDFIRITGARTHNLKNIDIEIPRNRFVVITGPSGSGKSSLAFDTIYAEGQRRYVESLSTYARQFLSIMQKPDVDAIDGLSPAIAIQQKSVTHNPRSTVGTVTEIYDYLRVLFARAGIPHCPEHHITLDAQTIGEMADRIMTFSQKPRLMLTAPLIRGRRGSHQQIFEQLRSSGFLRVLVDDDIRMLDDVIELDPNQSHDIEVIVDRFKIAPDARQRLIESLETAIALSHTLVYLRLWDDPKQTLARFNATYACPMCGFSLKDMEPRLFSFNHPDGACPECNGLGVAVSVDLERLIADPQKSIAKGAIGGWERSHFYFGRFFQQMAKMTSIDLRIPYEELSEEAQIQALHGCENNKGKPFEGFIALIIRRYRETESQTLRAELSRYLVYKPCAHCHGSRLNQSARHVKVGGYTLPDLVDHSILGALRLFEKISIDGKKGVIAQSLIKEINQRLNFLINVGLDYLTLARHADTLSGGESQRIRLASQMGAGLVGVTYVLDEPSIGLHPRDNARLLNTLRGLRDMGNNLIVVEHDEETMRHADFIIDMGPGAGRHGGNILATGNPQEIMQNPDSITGHYLSGASRIEISAEPAPEIEQWIKIRSACGHNLKDLSVDIPLGCFILITGVSGSGKSTLINDTLYPYMARQLHGLRSIEPEPVDRIEGIELLDKIIAVDQQPIGRTPRSNPATYTGVFTPIRELFAATAEARTRGYKPGRFSFNIKGGRCEACEGDGLTRVEMHFLPDLYVPCEICVGKRYNRETLEIHYKGKSIWDILAMSADEAAEFFSAIPVIRRKLDTLKQVGLGYLALGQSATTLSGGEAQRIKLARELARRDTGRTLYILDEPTTGLHFHDIAQLLDVLHALRDRGNTVIVIEHHLDVIKTADYIIDLGPEGGQEGGQVVAVGAPDIIMQEANSYTGRYLKQHLETQASALRNFG